MDTPMNQADDFLDSGDTSLYDVAVSSGGIAGSLPIDSEQMGTMRSGDLFGWTQNVAMGINPARMSGREYLLLSTLGGRRGADGEVIALGYHTGHWELGMLIDAAARELTRLGGTPFAGHVSDPCDGRTNGTEGMLDSLPYRNDAAIVLRRLARSLPNRAGVLGIATCDKGLPAMLMAVAGLGTTPSVIVPGGVMLATRGPEDTGSVQSLASRVSRGEVAIDYATTQACAACGSSGGGCQFMGTAATSQVVAEALGLTLPHSALHPSGTQLWVDMARRSAAALDRLAADGVTTADVLSQDSIHNAMVLHAAVGGSTNLFIHLPAIAHAAGLRRPTMDEWRDVNRNTPRLVDALPNGPRNFATAQVFLAGGVPEVMLTLAQRGDLRLGAKTVSGRTLGENLAWWESSERRSMLRERLLQVEGIDPAEVIRPESNSLPGTVTILGGNLSPEGGLMKSTALGTNLLDDRGQFLMEGPARVFTSESDAMAAIKNRTVTSGDVVVLIGIGPSFGMPETYQVTAALKHSDDSGSIGLITDGRFSGVSTGPCVGHISPEAAAGGPIGKIRDGDQIRIFVDTVGLSGSVEVSNYEEVVARSEHPNLHQNSATLPDDTRLWAALQSQSGGAWGGCVYDVDAIVAALKA